MSRKAICRVSVIICLQYSFVYCVTDMSFSQERVFIVEHYSASCSYACVADEFHREYQILQFLTIR
ncbi:hypothetical protein B7P43_G09153 [Cryptotermes secundus]|uniref:Secreted protein n=1 Tax=Cryptotermes secundus TaxID=105785 RepID=A0A2J7Q8N5_9NEOP|nr:hypothetical protein B7P43_G09153 [Cryptotermes secundus]